MTIEEFELAEMFGNRYPRLSKYDRIALAIAVTRKIILLTGDNWLRKAAITEKVKLFGTLGVLDELYRGEYISLREYESCLLELKRHNGQKDRLPKDEISLRLGKIHIK